MKKTSYLILQYIVSSGLKNKAAIFGISRSNTVLCGENAENPYLCRRCYISFSCHCYIASHADSGDSLLYGESTHKINVDPYVHSGTSLYR